MTESAPSLRAFPLSQQVQYAMLFTTICPLVTPWQALNTHCRIAGQRSCLGMDPRAYGTHSSPPTDMAPTSPWLCAATTSCKPQPPYCLPNAPVQVLYTHTAASHGFTLFTPCCKLSVCPHTRGCSHTRPQRLHDALHRLLLLHRRRAAQGQTDVHEDTVELEHARLASFVDFAVR